VKREIYGTSKPDVFCCPVEMKDEVIKAGGQPVKTGQKWFYFRAEYILDILNCLMPFSMVFRSVVQEAITP